LNVDNFINTHLCEIATDEDQVTTTAFFRDGSIGAHIEGYKVPYKSEVACDEDALCQEAFEDNTYVCFKDKCADRGRNYQVLDTNVYRITFMFDPGKKVVKEGENIEFDVYIYGPNGQEIVDLSGDDDDTNDHVKLASGGEIYQKSGSDQIVFVTDKKYTKVCMEFKDTGVFTSEFKKILDDVGDGSSLCNSFVNEGHDMGPNAPGLGDFFIKLSSLGAYTGEDSGISGADPIVADVDTDVDGIADSTSGGGELRP
ncbi:hypothetical protein GOV08_04005, partial [Candidatus Woesearchaeota archaeon]|nr:hypothetical protein [Candidatus Woesearchaeota archaeon]